MSLFPETSTRPLATIRRNLLESYLYILEMGSYAPDESTDWLSSLQGVATSTVLAMQEAADLKHFEPEKAQNEAMNILEAFCIFRENYYTALDLQRMDCFNEANLKSLRESIEKIFGESPDAFQFFAHRLLWMQRDEYRQMYSANTPEIGTL